MFFKKKVPFNIFLERVPELDMVLRYGKPDNEIAGHRFEDITFLPYQVLKHEIPEMMAKGDFEEVIYTIAKYQIKNINFKVIKRLDNYKKLKFIIWIRKQYELIRELERNHLSSPPDGKLVKAGIQRLDVLGDVNLIDSLAGGDVLKWKEVRQLPYSTIFDKQLKTKIEAEINKKLAEENAKEARRKRR